MNITIGIVDEAVLRALDDHDLAIGPAVPRGPQRFDIGGGRPRIVRTEERERGRHLRGDGERIDAMTGPAPRFRRAHHAVERHGRVEPIDGGRLERVVPAHAEAEHRDA